MRTLKRKLPSAILRKLVRQHLSITGILFFLPGIAYVVNLNFGFTLNYTMYAWFSLLFGIMGAIILYFNGRKIAGLIKLFRYGNTGMAVLSEIYEAASGEMKLYKLVFIIEHGAQQYSFSEEISGEITYKTGHTYLAIYPPDGPEEARIAEMILPELMTWLAQEQK